MQEHPFSFQPPPWPEQSEAVSAEERIWALAAHLSIFSGNFIPCGHLLAPLVIWLLRRHNSAFVAEHAKETLNAQIAYTVYIALCFIIALVGFIFGVALLGQGTGDFGLSHLFRLGGPTLAGVVLGIVFFCVIWVGNLVCAAIAAFKAYDGGHFRYPMIFRLL